MKDKLPNFLIVGAAKSGTSSLHNYLNQHPEVFMPSYDKNKMKVKEPRFLIKDLVEHKLHNGIWSWKEYQSLFEDVKDEKVIGESSVLYLYYYKHTIRNIKLRLGYNVKIIIMLRNPADRAYSAFHHVSRGFQEQYSFEEALTIEEGRLENDNNLTPMVMYKDMGLYYKMVKAYLDAFEHVHIILYDDFRDKTDEVLDNVYHFLAIDKNQIVDSVGKHNVGGKKWKSKKLKQIFMKSNIIKWILKLILPKQVRKVVREKLVNLSMQTVVPMQFNTRRMLNEFFKDDVEKLSELLNKDLTHWTK